MNEIKDRACSFIPHQFGRHDPDGLRESMVCLKWIRM
jgi:hypothetical protein